MADLKDEEYTYSFDMERKVDSNKSFFFPDMDYQELSESINNTVKSAEYVEKRFNKKDLDLAGSGKITNKMLMLEIEGKNSKGESKDFYWNIGSVSGAKWRRFTTKPNIEKLRDFLNQQFSSVLYDAKKEYGDDRMEFGMGFKVKSVILRSIVKTSPSRVGFAKLKMGIRNLKVNRMG